MKFRCEREALVEALGLAVRVSGNRTASTPALSGVRLEVKGDNLTIACTDTDMIIQFTLPVNGIENGVSVPRARLLNDVVRSMGDGAIEIEQTGDELTVRGGRSQINLQTYLATDFPILAPAAAADASTPAGEFADALRQVVRAASTEEGRGALVGVLITHEKDGIKLVATDSFRLAVRTLPHSSIIGVGEKVIVPGRALGELQRLLAMGTDLTVRWAEPIITFIVGNASLTTRTINGEFPNFQRFVDIDYPNVLTVNREILLEAIRRAKIVLPKSIGLKMHLNATGVRIEAADRDLGSTVEEIDATYVGQEMTIGFNVDYLAAGIEALETEDVRIAAVSPQLQAVVRSGDNDDYHYFVMPVRVNS